MTYYKVCRVQCKRCENILEHVNQTKDDRGSLMMCWCGLIGLDPAADGYRVLGDPENYIDTSEPWEEERTMLGLSHRPRIILAIEDARQLVHDRAEYYNLLRHEEVQELLNQLQAIQDDWQQKYDEGYAELEKQHGDYQNGELKE